MGMIKNLVMMEENEEIKCIVCKTPMILLDNLHFYCPICTLEIVFNHKSLSHYLNPDIRAGRVLIRD